MKTHRKVAALATAIGITIGGVLVAPSASADDWIQGGCSVARGITGDFTYSATASPGCWVAVRAYFHATGAPEGQYSWTSWTPDGVSNTASVTTPFPVLGGEVRANNVWRNLE